MGKFEAIFFDMGETLVYQQPTADEVFFQVLEEHGWSISREEQLAGLRWARKASSSYDVRLRENEMSPEELWGIFLRDLLEVLGIRDATPRQLKEIAAILRDLPSKMVCPPEVPALLGELQQAGYHLGIISNWDHTLEEHCERHGLSRYFDGIYASFVVGSSKPDAGIFRHALDQAGVPPQRALHVGDNYHADVLGARAIGMHPVLLDPNDIYQAADCAVIRSIADLRAHL